MKNNVFINIKAIPDPDLHNDLKPDVKEKNKKKPEEQIKTMSCSPDMNKIISIEMFSSRKDNFYTLTPTNKLDQEINMLTDFWSFISNADLIVGFGLSRFDIPTVLFRSMMLGIRPSIELSMKKYSRSPIYDISMILSNWDISCTRKINWYLKRFGLPAITEDASQVYQMHKDEKYQEISESCRNNVLSVKALFERTIEQYPANKIL